MALFHGLPNPGLFCENCQAFRDARADLQLDTIQSLFRLMMNLLDRSNPASWSSVRGIGQHALTALTIALDDFSANHCTHIIIAPAP